MDTILSESVGFNPAHPIFMHIDLNSCFASVEQQANPLLRGKPVAVAAYPTNGGCILAASREAKALGVKTGMRVGMGKSIIPGLTVLTPDPPKYRFVNRKLLGLLQRFSSQVEVKSIDEMVVSMGVAQQFWHKAGNFPSVELAMEDTAREIKKNIKEEIGEWLTVSVGISTNRYLAKVASGLHKPDGLDTITGENAKTIFSAMQVEELCGIKTGYGSRLRRFGITTALAMYNAPIKTLMAAFSSIVGYHWWLRLHGWEADDRQFDRKSFGQSYAFGKKSIFPDPMSTQILCQLCQKMARRMRMAGYSARGIHCSVLFTDGSFWHKGALFPNRLLSGSDCFSKAKTVLSRAPQNRIRILAVSVYCLLPKNQTQLGLFETEVKKEQLTAALDTIDEKWGAGSVFPGTLLSMDTKIQDRISFGGVKELEEFVFRSDNSSEPAAVL